MRILHRSLSSSCSVQSRLTLTWLLVTTIATLSIGCVQHGQRLRSARQAFWAGDLEVASETLRKAQPKRRDPKEYILADQAMVALMQGDAAAAETMLRQVRDRFDLASSGNAGASALSMVADDRRLPYGGEDYEKILVRCFLAIANLSQGGEDAMAYSLQVNQTQQQIIEAGIGLPDQNPKLAYPRIALGAYLHGVLQEETHRGYDEAARAYEAVTQWNPNCASAHHDLARAQHGTHSAKGNGVLYVIGLVGLGPYKEERTAQVTTEAMAVASQLLHLLGDHDIPQFTAPVKIPQIVIPPPTIDALQVFVSGSGRGPTETITDVNQVAFQQSEVSKNHTIARAVVRRVVKKSAVYGVKDQLSTSPWTGLAFDAAEYLWEASESADLRCWSLLPAMIQLRRIELPAGTHEIAVQPIERGRLVGTPHPVTVEIQDGVNTYILACFPDREPIGKILTHPHH